MNAYCKLEDCDTDFAHIHLASEVTFNECYMAYDVQWMRNDEMTFTALPRYTDVWGPPPRRWLIFNLTRRATAGN